MKKISVFICLQLWLIFCLSVNAQDFRLIADGIEHAKITRKIKDEPVTVNLLRLDLTKVRLDVVHALDAAIGTETVSSIATRHGAIAAINAGFFRLDKTIFAGDAVGVLMIDGKLLSESYGNRIALLIKNNRAQTQVDFEKISISFAINAPKHIWRASGVNRERKDNELILFTPEFHQTTLTNNNGLEVIVNNGIIIRILKENGSNQIPANGFVLSASGKFKDELAKYLRVGQKVSIAFPLDT